jgi:hypothetical protein
LTATRRGALLRLALGPQVLGKTLAGEIDDAIGGGEDRIGRAVVAVERDDIGRRVERVRKIEDVADRRGAEGIDRLGVVPDHGQADAAGFHRHQDRRLQAVGVLVFVDEDVVETAADILRNRRLAHHLRPVEQEVVVIQHVLGLLGLDIGGEQFAQLRFPGRAPGEIEFQHLVQRRFGIHRTGIDLHTRALGRKPVLGLREAGFVAHQVHQVGGIFPVVDGEVVVEADLFGIEAEQPGADAVEGAGPGKRVGHDAGIGS